MSASPPSRKRFEVRSAHNAKFFRSDRAWAAISISTEGDWPELDSENRKGLLRIAFADTADEMRSDAMTASQALQILDFVKRMWEQIEVLLIHCEAGMSRSPGVAAALSEIYYQNGQVWFEHDFPNGLVYQRLLESHGRIAS